MVMMKTTRIGRWIGVGAVALVAACGGATPEEIPEPATTPAVDTGAGSILRLDPAFDELVGADAVIEHLADGFGFTEGPLWIEYHGLYGGAVLFSDIPGNSIVLWSSDGTVSSFLSPVFEGEDGVPLAGSNGITMDAEGRVVFTEHGNRRISRIEADGSRSVVVDRHDGRRLNSPNDLVYHSDGSLYFTDPPYGLAQQDDDPAKEIDVNGVYRLSPQGELSLLASLTRPNGIGSLPTSLVSTWPTRTLPNGCGWSTTWPPTARWRTSASLPTSPTTRRRGCLMVSPWTSRGTCGEPAPGGSGYSAPMVDISAPSSPRSGRPT